jgi:hypothetical protein
VSRTSDIAQGVLDRKRRAEQYANVDKTVAEVFELATMTSLGDDRGRWPDGMLTTSTIVRACYVERRKRGEDPSVGQLAVDYLECMAKIAKDGIAAQTAAETES